MTAVPSAALSPQRSCTVFASAGTGKTWLLVSRILRLLLDGADPGSLLAITFTRKAAGEMRERLLDRLRMWALADDAELDAALQQIGCAADASLRSRARSLYETLLWADFPPRISTFHAFCQDLLARFPLEAGVPPGFELLESHQEQSDAALDTLFAEATAAQESPLAHALSTLFDTCGGLVGTREVLKQFLAHRADWWAYTEGERDPVAAATSAMQRQFDVDPTIDYAARFFDVGKREELRAYAELLGDERNSNTLRSNAAKLKRVLGHDDPVLLLEGAAAAFLTQEGTLRKDPKPSKTLDKALGPDRARRLLDQHQALGEEMLALRDQLRRQRAVAVNRAWYLAGARYLELFQHIKRQRRQLDFADLEWLAYRLLNRADDCHWVQYKLDRQIEHLLIDEFQDTNPTQWRLLLPLLEEFAAASDRQRSVFLVGDAKQSIYGFRRANPELQEAAAEWLEKHLGSARASLDQSRRSAPAIINAVNRVFIAPGFIEQITAFHHHGTHKTALWGRVECLPVATIDEDDAPKEAQDTGTLRNPLTTPRPTPRRAQAAEASLIAARIQALVTSGWCIGEPGAERPIRYGDIKILLRQRTHAEAIEAALRAAHIPFRGTRRGGLLQRLEVRDVRALLTVLATPHDNLALAQVLRSPLFAAGDDDLARLAQPISNHRRWYDALLRLAPDLATDHPLARAAHWLKHWRKLTATLPLHDLLDRVFHEGDVLARYRAAVQPWQRAQVGANLQRLVELALELDSGRYPSLERFLERLTDLEGSDEDSPSEPVPEHDAAPVEILTIHAAKGLEAPVIFYAGLGAQQDKPARGGDALVLWPATEPRPTTFLLLQKKEHRDAYSDGLQAEIARLQARESANLLYVALTRARQMLVLSAAGNRQTKIGSTLYGRLRLALQGEGLDFAKAWAMQSGTIPTVTPCASADAVEPPTVAPIGLDKPFPAGQHPRSVTPSRAAVPSAAASSAVTEDEDGRVRGQAIHAFLDHLSRPAPRWRDEELLARIGGDLGVGADDPDLREWLEEARHALAAFPRAFRLEPGAVAYNELPIVYRVDERMVYGVIDRLVVTPRHILLIDYKTHRESDPQRLAAIAQQYRAQLGLYAAGVRRIWPRQELEAGLLFTHTGTWQPCEGIADGSSVWE